LNDNLILDDMLIFKVKEVLSLFPWRF